MSDDAELVLDLGLPAPATDPAPVTRGMARRSISYMVDEALRSGAASSLSDLVDQVTSFRQYRLVNALLAVLQYPHPNYLLPAHDWSERWGRTIRPEERPLVLLVPHGPVMFLYDIAQTEGSPGARPLPPHLLDPYAMRDVQDADYALAWLIMNAKHDGVRVTPGSSGHVLAGRIRRSALKQVMNVSSRDGQVMDAVVPVRYECMLNAGHSLTERLATLAHELGHLYCGHLGSAPGSWWPDRPDLSTEQEEFEAETTAQFVFRRIAPEAELPDHLAQYFPPGVAPPEADWTVITAAASRVIDMCQGSSPKKR